MRSSGRTMVSRTRERMLSLRRRRRGRRVMAAPVVAVSFVGFNVFVVIRFSGEIVGPSALGRAESAAVPGAMGAVGTEVAVADVTGLETGRVVGVPAVPADPLVLGHRNIFPREVFPEGCRRSLTVRPGTPTIP